MSSQGQRARLKVMTAGIFSLLLTLGVARFAYTPSCSRTRSFASCPPSAARISMIITKNYIES